MKHLLLTPIAALVLGTSLGQQQVPAFGENMKSERSPDKLEVSVMTFNTEWLFGSKTQVAVLEEKGIWGLEEKDTELEIDQQHQAVANIVARHAPDILCLQEVINEIAAKRFQKTLERKGMKYTFHFLESRDTYLEQDVVFFSNNNSKNITEIKVFDPINPVFPPKCVILTCLLNGEKTAFLGLHLKAVPTEPRAVSIREKQADAVVNQLQRLSTAGYATFVVGDINDWDPIVPDADSSEHATPTSQVLRKIKEYIKGGNDELLNGLQWVQPIENRYTYDYKGSKTVLDHILIPFDWKNRVTGVIIDHDRPERASDHWPVILNLSR